MLPVQARLIDAPRAGVVNVAGEIIEALGISWKALLAQLPDLVVLKVDAERPNAAVHWHEENAAAIVT
jgi:hypothetical protein